MISIPSASEIPQKRILFRKERVEVATTPLANKWSDCVYRYSGDVDVLCIYFTRATPGLIEESDCCEPFIFDYDAQKKIVAVEILDASRTLPCHFFNSICSIDSKPPFMFHCLYDESKDELVVSFVDESVVTAKNLPLDDGVVIAGLDKSGLLVHLLVKNARNTVCKVNS